MKISQTRMDFASEHQSEQMDAQITQESQNEIRLTRRRRRFSGQNALSRIFVDRVSFSQNQKIDIQTNYSADVHSRSSVKSADSVASMEFEQRETMERIVGGIIDKKVTIRQIQRNEDILMGKGSPGPTNGATKKTKGLTMSGSDTQSLQVSQLSLSHTQIHFEQETAQFSSKGQVTTKDGRVIDFSLDMSLERSFLSRTEEQTLIHRWQEEINLTDPLVISLDGKAPVLSETTFEFDLNNDGEMENINFTGAGSGFLALDRNADNIINNGSELFGPGTGNGFNELAGFDEDNNQWIDENDAVFSQLSVWTKDEDGQDRLVSLKDAGIGAIALDYADTPFDMKGSDNRLNGQLKQSGVFLFENGNVGSVHQIDLVSHKIGEKVLQSIPPDIEQVQPFAVDPPENTSSLFEMAQSQAVQASNPLQDLLDRIDELKARMASLMEEMNPLSEKRSNKRRWRRSYDEFRVDPSILLSRAKGAIRGSIRGRRWYG